MALALVGNGDLGSVARSKINSAITQLNSDPLGSGVLNVRAYGALGDGVTDDTTAFASAWAAAALLSRSVIYIPAGLYVIATQAASFRTYSNMTIRGDGMNASVIWWKNQVAGPAPLIGQQGLARVSNVALQDFGVRGNHDSDFTQSAHVPIIIGSADTVLISRVQVAYARSIALAVRDSYDVSVEGCWVHHSARDGISTADCSFVRITGNSVEFCDDDSIACHTSYLGPSDRGLAITGNTVRLCQGIKALGARSCTISGNTLEYCWGQGINVQTASTAAEGRAANTGVSITGNTIKNCLDRASIDNLNQAAPYIAISGQAAQAGTSAVIPGENNPATGLFEEPYPYFMNMHHSVTTAPVPASYNIIIANNILMRDMHATALFSDYGFGIPYMRSGPVDFQVTSATYLENGIATGPFLRNVLIQGNIFSGLNTPMAVSIQSTSGWYFRNNIVYDCVDGIQFNGSNTFSNLIHIDDNVFDIDPFHKGVNRGANGTWLANGFPQGILIQSAKGVSFRRNIFRNCCRPADITFTTDTSILDDKVTWENNILECDPAAVGFSTSNKGIGNIPPGPNFLYRIVNSDPASASFGTVKNHCPTAAAAMPTAGTYVRGHFIRNTNPVIATGKVILGWMRLTTGTAHVANTDWAALYATNS
jgi:hypothetical protein